MNEVNFIHRMDGKPLKAEADSQSRTGSSWTFMVEATTLIDLPARRMCSRRWTM